MDPTTTEVRSDGLAVSAGEKRPAEDCELSVPSPKKARSDEVRPRNVRSVAEIVLVLATLGKMRAGRNPTVAEMEMMAEARGKLVDLCQGFAPKDVFPREAFGNIIEDLGLSKLREEKVGFRASKMSIAEKLLVTKHQMEKSAQVPPHSAPSSIPQTQTKLRAAPESHLIPNAGRMFHLNKPTGPKPSVGLQPASPLGQVSTAKPTSLPYQLPNSEVKPVISSGLPTSHVARDGSSLAMPRVEGPHFRLDGRSNGSSYTSQVQASAYSSGDHTTAKTPTWSFQPQSSQSVKFGSDHKMTAQTSAKVEGTAHPTTSKPFITQTTPKNPAGTRQHLQGAKQGIPHSSHNEIGKIIKKLLQPQIPVHLAWTPPSRDYMNKALGCQICKLIINEVAGVLVCDGCEKGYHLKCLQSNYQKSIPRGEWHCPKCLSLNNGKPLPPKYGRVMRNIPATKSAGTPDKKVNQLGITANGNSGSMMSNGSLAGGAQINDKPPGMCPNNLMKASGSAVLSPSADSSSEGSLKQKIVTESDPQPPAKSGSAINSFVDFQEPRNIGDNNQTGVPKRSEVPSEQRLDSELPVEESKNSIGRETLNSNPNHETKVDEQGPTQTKPVETSGTCIIANEQATSVEESPKSFGGETLNSDPNYETKVDERGSTQTKPVVSSGNCINHNEQASLVEDSAKSFIGETFNSYPCHETKVDEPGYTQTKPVETSGTCISAEEQASLVEESVKSFGGETLNSNPNHETKVDEQVSTQTKPVETSETCIITNKQASSVGESAKSFGGETLNTNLSHETKVDEQGSPQTKPVETSGIHINADEQASSVEESVNCFGGGNFNSSSNHETKVDERGSPQTKPVKTSGTYTSANEQGSSFEEPAKSFGGETFNPNPNHETKVDEGGSPLTNTVETSGTCISGNEQASSSSDGLHSVDWTGSIIKVVDEKKYYQSCCIGGVVYNVQDHALLILDNKLLPSKLQSMWEDSKTRLKWVAVNRCYFPEDLPEGAVHPFPIENNEVYESNHVCTVMAGFIQGPCKVIHPSKLTEESETGTELEIEESDGQQPSFLCKWLYDESKGLFRSISS